LEDEEGDGVNNITLDRSEIGCENVDCIEVTLKYK